MIDVFERLAPSYGRAVRKFAIDVWYGRAEVSNLMLRANAFRLRYERELTAYFRENGIQYTRARVQDLSERWLADQILVARRIQEAVAVKKDKLLLERMDEAQKEEVIRLLTVPARPEGRVSPVVSFQENFAARAIQIGEEQAFALGRDINSDAVQQNSSTYLWQTQEDRRVRPTHRKLGGKLFSWESPPTTIDRYGNRHTGNPGTDWGCRCWEVPATGKPLLNFVARE